MPEEPPPFVASHALVIGISEYANGIPRLHTPRADALELRKLLQREHGFQVESLIHRGTAPRIRAALARLAGRVGPDDRALFYFAGHGHAYDGDERPRGFLIPEDAHARVLDTYLPMDEVYATLDALPCRHVLAILDCCFAGAFHWAGTRDLEAPPRVLYHERYARYVKSPARQLLVSADHDQKALDSLAFGTREPDPTRRHSPFAAALLDGLRGTADAAFGDTPPDRVVTASELLLYLRSTAELRVERRGVTQTPRLFGMDGHDRGEYVFLLPGFAGLEKAPPIDEKHNPYRGLEPFRTQDKHLFFGRDRVIDALAKLASAAPLAQRADTPAAAAPLTIVTGPSGSGKSSVVLAGLVPRLEEDRANLVLPPFRPLADPLGSLVASLRKGLGTAGTDSIAKDIGAWLSKHPERRLFLVVDQLEEVLAIGQEKHRDAFLALLAGLLAAHPERLRVVVTLRSDEEPHFKRSPLAPWWTAEARYVVPPMTTEELRQAIERPAAEKALELERGAENLTDLLIGEVFDTPGALPLLSFMLSELYRAAQRRYVAGDRSRELRVADFRELRGVAGVLERRANELHDGLSPEDQRALQRLVLRMVAVEHGAIRRRRVHASELVFEPGEARPEETEATGRKAPKLTETERTRRMKAKLADARLAVIDTQASDPTIEPAHDALVRGWSRLRAWLDDEAFHVQRRVTLSTEEWEADGRRRRSLWDRDNPLDKALERLAVPGWFNVRETAFLRRSRRKANLFRAVVAATLVILAAAVLVVQVLRQRTEDALTQSEAAHHQTQLARNESQARALAAQALVEPADEDPRHLLSSALMGIESLRRLPTPNGDRAVRRALQLLLPLDPRLGGDWIDAAVTADGAWAAMIDRDHRVWVVRVSDGAKHLLAIPPSARALAFSPDRRWLAVAGARTIRLYTGYDGPHPIQDGAPIETAAEVRRVAFSGRSRWLIVGTGTAADRDSSLWEIAGRKEIAYMKPGPGEGKLRDIVISPDERWLVTILDPVEAPTGEEAHREHAIRGGGAAALWETERERRHVLTRCAGDEAVEIVPPVVFSEDATWLAAMTSGTQPGLLLNSGTATFTAWHLRDPEPSSGPSPAGVWRERLQDGGEPMIGLPIRATFLRSRSSPDLGLAGGNHYGEIAVWSPSHEETAECDVHHDPSFRPESTSAATIGRSVTAIAGDPATSRLAVGFEQGYVRIWDLENKREESRVIAQDLPIEELAFVAGKLVTRTAKGVSFWAAPNDDVASRYRAHHASGVVFLGDDRRLAVRTGDRETTIFDRDTGHRLGAPIPAGGEVLRWNAARQELVIAGERVLRRCRFTPTPACEDPLHGSKLAVDGTGSIAAAVDEAQTVALIDLSQPTLAPRPVVLRDPRRHDDISMLAIAVGHLAVVYDDGQGGLFALDGTFLDAIPGALFASPLKMELSNDGSRLAIGKLLGTLDLYAIEGGKLRHYASAPTSRQIAEIIFNADGSLIATVHPDGDNNHVHVWRVANGHHLVATSAGRSDGDRHLAFSATSRWLAILEEPESIDVPPAPATVSIVPLQAPDLIELACRRLPPWAAIDPRHWRLVSSDPPPRPCSPVR